jgi:hypothetical protein
MSMAMLDWASYYCSLGLSIIPTKPGMKSALIPWKEFQEHCPPTELVCEWFTQWPNAGIAVVLGAVSNLFAIDIDAHEAHQTLTDRLAGIPVAPTVISGSRQPFRYHLYFADPGVPTRAKICPWHAKLEFRGKGGLVLLPPSSHMSGHRYEWAAGRSLWELPRPAVPEPILQELQGEIQRRRPRKTCAPGEPVEISPLASTCRATAEFLEGQCAAGPHWNDRLFRAACDLAGSAIPLEVADPLLMAGAQPSDDTEVENARRTIESAYSQARVPARLYARQTGDRQPLETFSVGGIVVRQFAHLERRRLGGKIRFDSCKD